jgi:uncharacterized damage-inducible protein DinB
VALDVKAEFLHRWEGNRRLTLRTAQAFPPESLGSFTPTAPLRPFGVMLDEIARLELSYIRGLAEDRWAWDPDDPPRAADAAGTIALLEEVRAHTRAVWDRIPAATLFAPHHDPFFFGDEKTPYEWLTYCLENEIHHRGQGYVYLRHLGVEPPPFWER